MGTNLTTDFSFLDIVPDIAPLTVVDVGALPLQGHSEIYAPLMERGKAVLYAFEANDEGCAKLATRLGAPHQVFPAIVGDGNTATFHHNKAEMTDSLFPPNMELSSCFSALVEFVEPVGTEQVNTQRLDDLISAEEIDFLKMDVQGGELLVLDGAPRLAPTALAVHSEVEFVPMYVGQPLFADIDTRLRHLGFQFHTFKNYGSRPYQPVKAVDDPNLGFNQWLWSDATYVPDITRLDRYSDERLLKLAVILHDFYESVDLALHILATVRDRGVPKPFQDYCARLGLG